MLLIFDNLASFLIFDIPAPLGTTSVHHIDIPAPLGTTSVHLGQNLADTKPGRFHDRYLHLYTANSIKVVLGRSKVKTSKPRPSSAKSILGY